MPHTERLQRLGVEVAKHRSALPRYHIAVELPVPAEAMWSDPDRPALIETEAEQRFAEWSAECTRASRLASEQPSPAAPDTKSPSRASGNTSSAPLETPMCQVPRCHS